MTTKRQVLLLLFITVASTPKLIPVGMAACSSGCAELVNFYESNNKWVHYSSTGIGHARTCFADGVTTDVIGNELVCYKKLASTSQGTCYHICNSCNVGDEPCQLDDCYPSSSGTSSYKCWEDCGD